MPQKTDICFYCNHPYANHHQGCNKCYAIPATHGNYCDEPLCCCVDFLEESLSDEDVAMLWGGAGA